jgi:hypothetical protein
MESFPHNHGIAYMEQPFDKRSPVMDFLHANAAVFLKPVRAFQCRRAGFLAGKGITGEPTVHFIDPNRVETRQEPVRRVQIHIAEHIARGLFRPGCSLRPIPKHGQMRAFMAQIEYGMNAVAQGQLSGT